MGMKTAVTYKDRDNVYYIKLKKNGALLTALEMAAITKFEIKFAGTYYNSVDNPTGFDITDATATIKILPNKLELPASDGDIVEVIVYDMANTSGVVWEQHILEIKDDAEV